MEKYVVTFTEDLASANDRKTDPSDFIAEMKLRAKVIPYEDELKAVHAEYQGIIKNLTEQLEQTRGYGITENEILWLNFIRAREAETGKAYQARITELEQNALKTAEDLQKKATLIRELFPDA